MYKRSPFCAVLDHRSARGQRASKLLLALVLAGVAPKTVFGAPEIALNARYQHVLDTVSTGNLALRRRFAEVALHALIEANQEEIARAGSTQPERRWQASTAQFVRRLERIFERLERVQEITVVQEPHGVVRLALDTDQVMLSVPRLSQQDRFDRALAAFFCHEVSCSQAAPELAEMVHANARAVPREWLFSDQEPPLMMAADGLNCTFADTRHLRLKESACEGVMHELRLVAAGLRAVTEHGGALDWNAFAVHYSPLDEALRVTYDRQGAYFNIELHYLVQAPEIWHEAIPWLQAKLRGHVGYFMIKAPERLAYVENG